MQEAKDNKTPQGTELTNEQAGDVAGGAECSPGVTVNVGGVLRVEGPTVAQVYDNIVDGTSHIIETVANAVKR